MISVASVALRAQQCSNVLVLLIAFIHLDFQLAIDFNSELKTGLAFTSFKESNINCFLPLLLSSLARTRKQTDQCCSFLTNC